MLNKLKSPIKKQYTQGAKKPNQNKPTKSDTTPSQLQQNMY